MGYVSDNLKEAQRATELARQYTFPALRVLAEIATDEAAPKRERLLAARMIAARTTRCRKCKEPLAFCGQQIPGGLRRYRNRLLCERCVLSDVRERQRRLRLTPEGRAKKLCASALRRAADIGVAFDLDAHWIKEKLEAGVCEVTLLPFDLTARGEGRQHPRAPSLDRKNPALGYTKDNVRAVVWIHNLAKSDWNDDCVISYARALLAANDQPVTKEPLNARSKSGPGDTGLPGSC